MGRRKKEHNGRKKIQFTKVYREDDTRYFIIPAELSFDHINPDMRKLSSYKVTPTKFKQELTKWRLALEQERKDNE
jgi:hypothetical protein